MKRLICIALLSLAALARGDEEATGQASGDGSRSVVSFLEEFRGPWHIDRNPQRKLVPNGQTKIFDGGTEITIVRDEAGRKISICYYGKNSLRDTERDGLFSVSGFSDKDGFAEPSFRIPRGSVEEVLVAKILASLPLRTDYKDLQGILETHQKMKGEQGVAPQSATRSESDAEGRDKPQPESETRPR